MWFPEDLEDSPFKVKIFSNFVAFSVYRNFKKNIVDNGQCSGVHLPMAAYEIYVYN